MQQGNDQLTCGQELKNSSNMFTAAEKTACSLRQAGSNLDSQH